PARRRSGAARAARWECTHIRRAPTRQAARARAARGGDSGMSTGVVTPLRSTRSRAATSHCTERVVRRRDPLLVGLAVISLLVPVAAVQGGYFPPAWGWAGL